MKKIMNLNNKYTVRIIPPEERKSAISADDADMDNRVQQAVIAALNRAAVCKKPIAGYDVSTRKAYIEYTDGKREYV